MPTAEYILERLKVLEARHGEYHNTCKHLRAFWDGKMWEDEGAMARSLTQVFRDLRKGQQFDREPDVKVTLPLIEAAVTKHMAFLSSTPQINVMTPPAGFAGLRSEQKRRDLADQNEEFLYGTWETNNVDRLFQKQAWYLPLMGCCFVGTYPDAKGKVPRFVVRTPEISFPVWDYDTDALLEIGFKWSVTPDVAKRMFPGPPVEDTIAQLRNGQKVIQPVEIIEWYDQSSKTTLLNGHVVQTVTHDLGFCPWVMPEFYHVPDTDFGKGIIEGNAQLFQKLNMLDSLELQAIIENVFARLVLINPAMAPEDIDDGPGAVIPIQQGGDAKWLTPPATTMDLSTSMARSLDFSQRGTHLPGSAYGEGVASSITTGKAQAESLLPTGSIVDYVQGNIGHCWQRLNEMTVELAMTVFKNTEMTLFGRRFGQGFIGWVEGPKNFDVTLKGSDLKGWSRHELTFQPTMNAHERLVMGLQMQGGGLVSKRYVRNSVGVVDSDAMKEEILSEMLEEAWLGGYAQQIVAGQMTPLQVEQDFLALDKGAYKKADPNAPITGMPAFQGMPGMGGPGGPMPPGGPIPGGAVPPSAGPLPPSDAVGAFGANQPPAAPAGPQGRFTIDQVTADFQKLKKIRGDIWLVGEIAQKGSTDGPIEVALTETLDKATIINGLPAEYRGNLTFHVVTSVPAEQHVLVTPGSEPTPGGGPTIDHPNTVAANTGGITPVAPFPAGPKDQPALAANLPAGGFQGSIRS